MNWFCRGFSVAQYAAKSLPGAAFNGVTEGPGKENIIINGGAAGALSGTINWMNLVQGGTQGTFDLAVGLSGITGTSGSSAVLQSLLSSAQGSGVLTFQFTDGTG